MVHVMTVAGLAGSTMTASIVGYDAIAMTEEEKHLCVPVVGRKGSSVTENDRLTFAPILVKDLRAVFRLDAAHVGVSLATFGGLGFG
jgi:hypothetical protein